MGTASTLGTACPLGNIAQKLIWKLIAPIKTIIHA